MTDASMAIIKQECTQEELILFAKMYALLYIDIGDIQFAMVSCDLLKSLDASR